ncbi:MAG TPA: ATP-grasp domain-containing protein [Candidatus Cybelea sp.]|nr:ATP-grasp domain-containing protein [Candidatus Cybelea sp.]
MALADTGFTVEAVCPCRHPLQKTSSVRRIHNYDSSVPAASFADAIALSSPDLLIPGDEYAICQVYKLYNQARQRGESGGPVCALIERSVGPSESFPIVSARAPLMRLAEEEGIRVPKTAVVRDVTELRKCCERFLFPLALKADGTSSGEGVRIVRTIDEAEGAFGSLESPPSVLRAVKRALIDQDMSLITPVLLRKRSRINAQEFIEGRDATSLVACWKGQVLAHLQFEVLKKQHRNGPASVMRRIENRDMSAATSKIVNRLRLSGLHGFDFLLEKQTGSPCLIEMNARPTQVGHLRLGAGHDLPAALYAQVTGTTLPEAPKLTTNDTIALFPQEWIRNPASDFLRSAYHDVPWEEPELMREGARKHRNWSAWLAGHRWVTSFKPERIPPADD